MALSLRNHPKVRTSVGVPLIGGDVYKASINGTTLIGWFVPLQGGLSVSYSNDVSRHKKDGWVSLVDYDSPMYSITLNCMYSTGDIGPARGRGSVSGAIRNWGFNPGFGIYDPSTGGGILTGSGNPAVRSAGAIFAGPGTGTGTGGWYFSVGDVWRFWIDRGQSDRGVASPSRSDFVGTNLLLEPGTRWNQPANGFWQFTMNFANLLGSPAMTGGKNTNYSSVGGIPTPADTGAGRTSQPES